MKKSFDRFPSKGNALAHIKDFLHGDLKTIIDVGVLTSTIELLRTFKEEKQILIEPIVEYHEKIKENYKNHNYELLNIALSNRQGKQTLELKNHLPSTLGKTFNVTASNLVFKDDADVGDEADSIVVDVDTLDNICAKNDGPFLVKIDVDGAEFEILSGLNESSEQVYCIIIECWVSRVSEMIDAVAAKGFFLWDIIDLSYMRGQLSQVDLVFMNNSLDNNPKYKEITPRNFGFNSDGAGNYAMVNEKLLSDKFAVLDKISKSGKI